MLFLAEFQQLKLINISVIQKLFSCNLSLQYFNPLAVMGGGSIDGTMIELNHF